MTQGIKISLKKDVKDVGVEECAIDTRYSSPKIVSNDSVITGRSGISNPVYSGYNLGSVEYTFPDNPSAGTYTLVTFKHGLGQTPNPIAYVYNYQFPTFRILPMDINFAYDPLQYMYCYATPTEFKIDYVRGNNILFPSPVDVTGYHYKFKFYIFANEGG